MATSGQTVLSGPERSGNERRFKLLLPDGRPAVLAQLLPELARDEALRRRYVRDAEWLASLRVDGVAEVLAVGPLPDPRQPTAEPPWRLRLDPPGETLEAWLAARAPAPLDEVIDLGVELLELLERVHQRGAVLRDLQPRQIVLAPSGPVLTDVGLARLDILSTRTAGSLLLEASPYAAPEHLRSTRVDARADLYSAGVILWRALTGALPFGDGHALLRQHAPLPPLAGLRAGAPEGLDELLGRLLAERPEGRPDSAREVAAALRGEPTAPRSLAVVVCQACGARLRAGLRLCLRCGKQAVQFHETSDGTDAWGIELVKVREDAAYLEPLREILETVSTPPLPPLNFLTEHPHMYSKEEKAKLIKVPVRLFDGLTRESAEELLRRMKERGLEVRTVSRRRLRQRRMSGAATAIAGGAAIAGGIAAGVALVVVAGGIAAVGGGIAMLASIGKKGAPLLKPRPAAAALPAADPLLARLGAVLAADARDDVREQTTEIAVLVQRLAQHRSEHAGAAREIDFVTGPVVPLVALLEKQVAAVLRIDRELGDLEEGTMVRALVASEARGEPAARRAPILAGLDRLRSLEDDRARHMQRLLEASTLLRRAIETGLRVSDPDAVHRAELQQALAALAD